MEGKGNDEYKRDAIGTFCKFCGEYQSYYRPDWRSYAAMTLYALYHIALMILHPNTQLRLQVMMNFTHLFCQAVSMCCAQSDWAKVFFLARCYTMLTILQHPDTQDSLSIVYGFPFLFLVDLMVIATYEVIDCIYHYS